MLCISRKKLETIVAETSDGPMTIHICRTGKTVQIGIEAPKSIAIRRGELPPKEKEVA